MKTIFAIILNFLVLCVHAQSVVRINVELKGDVASDTLALSWGAINKASTPFISQRAVKELQPFEVPINEPRLMLLMVKGCQGSLEIMASPGENITVSGRLVKEEGIKKPTAYFRHIRIKGASRQEEYEHIVSAYQQRVDSMDRQVERTFQEPRRIMRLSKQYKNEQAIADMYRTLDGQIYVQTMQAMYDMKRLFLSETVLRLRDSFYGPLMLLRFGGRLDDSYRPLYDEMNDVAQQSYYGREVREEVYPPTLQGNVAPTVKVYNVNGEEKLLNFVHHGSRYLLIDFWASWCEPCHKEVPNLKSLYEKYHNDGLDIISISADQSREQWLETLDDLDLQWCNYIDTDKQAIMEYKVQYIPSIFILDNNGNIIAEKMRGSELVEFVKNLFVAN